MGCRRSRSSAATRGWNIGYWRGWTRTWARCPASATRAVLRRQWTVFGEAAFERLAKLSNGTCTPAQSRVRIATYAGSGIARARHRSPSGCAGGPIRGGNRGSCAWTTVHQGDLDGEKGVYHINVVDEVTQYQHVGTVAAISEAFLIPVLQALIEAFPFQIKGFHADNGSEYINHHVAALLTKLHIGAFTKSRARRTNDNALVESKNASVVRKWLGYAHIPQRFAGQVNAFNRDWLSPFLNYHRPCLFPTEHTDAKGRVRKRYRDADVMTPYEKLKSLEDAEQYLPPGMTFEELDASAHAVSDLQAARALNGPGRICLHPSKNRTTPQPERLSRRRPVDLWTSPSDRLAPCGPWGQPVDNAPALTTACPHSRASRPRSSTGPTTNCLA